MNRSSHILNEFFIDKESENNYKEKTIFLLKMKVGKENIGYPDQVTVTVTPIFNCEKISNQTYRLNGQYDFEEIELLKTYFDNEVSIGYCDLIEVYSYCSYDYQLYKDRLFDLLKNLKTEAYRLLDLKIEEIMKDVVRLQNAKKSIEEHNSIRQDN